MKLLEYKAREIFEKYGIPVPAGVVIDDIAQLDDKFENIGYPVVVKAQVQTGGRGKAGGIRFAHNLTEVKDISSQLLHSTLKGLKVNQLLIVSKVDSAAEWYLSIILDRLHKVPVIIFSPCGGVDIEETARLSPDKIIKVLIDPFVGVKEYMVRYIINKSGIGKEYLQELYQIISNLYQAFTEYDCLLAEINPLMVCQDNTLIAADGKIDIDDNALVRQPEIVEFRDTLQEDPLILEARRHRFLYIPLENEGPIGVMSNGSGMLMSCIDLLSKENLKVGAALDLGGGATAERISQAVQIMFSNEQIKALFVSIFGGITRCDEVAEGIRLALEKMDKPGLIILRMEGTNKEKGLEIVKNIYGSVITVNGIKEGVSRLVERGAELEYTC